MKIGDKVHHIPFVGDTAYENGIIKSFHPYHHAAYIVYSCNDDWDNYADYTGQFTGLSRVKPGWIDKPSIDTEDE